MHIDTEINKEFECFMDKLNKLLNDERKNFIIDMCLSALDYIRVASKMIQLDDTYSSNDGNFLASMFIIFINMFLI